MVSSPLIYLVMGDSAGGALREARKLDIPGAYHMEFPEVLKTPQEILRGVTTRMLVAFSLDQPLLIVTVSEYPLLRVQRLIRAGQMKGENVVLYWAHDFGAEASIIRIDKDGSLLDELPGRMFEASFQERFDEGKVT